MSKSNAKQSSWDKKQKTTDEYAGLSRELEACWLACGLLLALLPLPVRARTSAGLAEEKLWREGTPAPGRRRAPRCNKHKMGEPQAHNHRASIRKT